MDQESKYTPISITIKDDRWLTFNSIVKYKAVFYDKKILYLELSDLLYDIMTYEEFKQYAINSRIEKDLN